VAGKPPKSLIDSFVADTHTMVVHELAEKYGKSHTTIKDWRLYCARTLGKPVGYGGVSQASVPIYDDWARVEGDVMILGDTEIPYHDAENISLMVRVAKRFGIKTLVINGDFVSADFMSHWPTEAGQSVPDDEQEFTEARRVLAHLLGHFDQIYINKGNHEQRMTRARLSMRALKWLFGADERVQVSHYMYCDVISGGVTYSVAHPADFSSTHGKVAAELATVHDCHTIIGHTHYGGLAFSKNGKYLGLDLGHSTREDTRHYSRHVRRKSQRWVSGFGMIRNGYAYPFYKDFTDFSFWLGDNNG
jgi:predicted phosphodiesterase